MRRRTFITAFGAAAGWACAARAHTAGRARRIGMLIAGSESDPEARRRIRALLQALEGYGWRNEQNISFEYRWEASSVERIREFAQRLASLQPDLLVAISSAPAALAFKQATRIIPIVFINVTDPVSSKLVETLARPNVNVTGFTNFEYSMVGKWLELLNELAPQVHRVALLFNPDTAPHARTFMDLLEPTATKLSVDRVSMPVTSPADVTREIEALGRTSGNGLIVANEAFTTINRKLIIGLANQQRIPAMYPFRFFAEDGGLMSYGVDQIDMFRRAASYIDRILRGENTTDLPVQQPAKFELLINVKTARALELAVPPSILTRADEVIE